LGRKLYPVMDSDGLTLKGARLYITARDFG
jgi:hypothetical protein